MGYCYSSYFLLTFFLPFPLLESFMLLPEEDHFMPEPMVCSTAYNPYQYKQAPPTHVILNVVDIIIVKISKNNSRFVSCIHYLPLCNFQFNPTRIIKLENTFLIFKKKKKTEENFIFWTFNTFSKYQPK